TVTTYTILGCLGSPVGSGITDTFGNFSASSLAGAEATTTFYALATDPAGNVSGCSVTGISYTEDDVKPAVPTLSVSPASPSNSDFTPTLSGMAEGNSTISLFNNNATCTGT